MPGRTHVEHSKRKAMLRQMVLLRAFEEKLEELYQRKAMYGSTHSYRGQEAIAVGVCSALQPSDLSPAITAAQAI